MLINRLIVLRLGHPLVPRADVANTICYRRSKGTIALSEQTANDVTGGGNDLGIELIDSWSTIADILTFYQERIASEGYLRTATERRSILELGERLDAIITKYAISDSKLANTCKESKEAVISLFSMLPEIYQRRDRESVGALKALLEVIEEQFEIVRRDLENLYEEWFIETLDPWELPCIGNSIVEDPFIRRIKFITDFPFPGEETKLDIWKQLFPQNVRLNMVDFEALQKKPKEH